MPRAARARSSAQQPALADARRALDQRDPAAPLARLAEQPVERGKLTLALEEAVHAGRIVVRTLWGI